jgi:16S rRNA processing protein RimM
VTTTGGESLGRVVEIQDYGAAPILVIKAEDGRELMIPLVLSICVDVDTTSKKIVVNPPEGLLDL